MQACILRPAFPLLRLITAALTCVALWAAVPAGAQGQARLPSPHRPTNSCSRPSTRHSPPSATTAAQGRRYGQAWRGRRQVHRVLCQFSEDHPTGRRQVLARCDTGTAHRAGQCVSRHCCAYSGAMSRVEAGTTSRVLPFRGDPTAADVVVRTQLFRVPNGEPTQIDYRLEKNPGWLAYLRHQRRKCLAIENYRNQFSQQISQNGHRRPDPGAQHPQPVKKPARPLWDAAATRPP